MANGRPAVRKSEGPFAYWALVLKDFGQAWIAYGVLSIIIAGITHGIFHIPLWQVVDVILALFLFFIGFFGSLSLIAFCLDLTRGEIILALGRIINIAMLPFLPVGAILGFLAYGYIIEQQFETTSFVYAGYVGVFADGYQLLAALWGDFLALMKPVRDAAGGETLAVDRARLVLLVQIASIVLAAAGFLISRSRVTHVADDTLRVSPFPVRNR
jgi:hypothetical protein